MAEATEAKLPCRVTDDPRVAELIEAAQRALDKAWEYGEDEPHFVRLNDALESFAQHSNTVAPTSGDVAAEGVSRADRNFPADAEHENGDYENRCVDCSELFTGYKRRVVCRACAVKRGDTP